MRLGVFGGTFDPVHYGHLVAAEEVRYRLRLDKVLFVPAGMPPHKLDHDITPTRHRVAMLELAIASNPGFALSRVDIDRHGPCYTVDTLALLHEEYGPGAELFFLMGMDSLADILTWKDPERLIRLARIVVVGRPGFQADVDELDKVLPGAAERICIVDTPLMEVSSSDIRQRVREGAPIRYQVPEAVEAYIRAHRLYVDDMEKK
ncbi:MAG: nicotinate-nucleotide adenylyltransferase [Anaerolineae bacterium]|nr:nicotinate-nucleotide adenylyltransferase [Anaerolineae bacterium]